MITLTGKYTTANIMIDHVEPETIAQITQMINLPAFNGKTVIMPDCHSGAGSVIGFTMPLVDKVMPQTVGTDIGCAMLFVPLPEGFDIGDRQKLDTELRKVIPFSTNVHDIPHCKLESFFDWEKLNVRVFQMLTKFGKKLGINTNTYRQVYNYKWFVDLCKRIKFDIGRAECSVGTVGGGNHFIEFGIIKSTGAPAFTIHSGSRQLGQKICNYWQKISVSGEPGKAKQMMHDGIKKIKQTTKHNRDIPTKIDALRKSVSKLMRGPGYLEGENMIKYLIDMIFAQTYAEFNRLIIAHIILSVLGIIETRAILNNSIETIHNYINFDDITIRKGAISAHKDELVIIPYNMEDGIIIGRGLGNPDWNYSAPHGAGRILSRTKAKELISGEDAKIRMAEKGIYASKVPADECKEAYKDPKIIEEAIKPTIEIVDRIKPIFVLKE